MDFSLESDDKATADELIFDYRRANLSPADRALCDYAVKLTLTPGQVGSADLDLLREFGFDDEALTILAQVIGYFNYINRVADSLGVDPEEWMDMPEDEWKKHKVSVLEFLDEL